MFQNQRINLKLQAMMLHSVAVIIQSVHSILSQNFKIRFWSVLFLRASRQSPQYPRPIQVSNFHHYDIYPPNFAIPSQIFKCSKFRRAARSRRTALLRSILDEGLQKKTESLWRWCPYPQGRHFQWRYSLRLLIASCRKIMPNYKETMDKWFANQTFGSSQHQSQSGRQFMSVRMNASKNPHMSCIVRIIHRRHCWLQFCISVRVLNSITEDEYVSKVAIFFSNSFVFSMSICPQYDRIGIGPSGCSNENEASGRSAFQSQV